MASRRATPACARSTCDRRAGGAAFAVEYDDDLLGSGNWDRYYVAADAYLDALPEDVYVIRIRIHS